MNKNLVAQKLGKEITALRPVAGGCIANAQIAETGGGELYFVKSYNALGSNILKNEILKNEANGLKELSKAKAVRIPEVIFCDDEILVIEFIQTGKRAPDFFEIFGRQFARQHKFTGESFGFFENNYIGATPQINIPQSGNWRDFYWQNRLLFQFKLAEKNGYTDAGLNKLFLKLESIYDDIIPGGDEPPSLLHGDLWSGNFISDESGRPVIIDPAVYYGCREADLAMTKLFGGFDSCFYSAYNEEYPLNDGWVFRENIYKLYHVLNHLNLFGGGYYGQAKQLIQYYL